MPCTTLRCLYWNLESFCDVYLYKSTVRPCLEYWYHAWAGSSSYYLDKLDKLKKQKCRIFGPSMMLPLLYPPLISFFIGITVVDPHLNWLNLFHFFILITDAFAIIGCMIFQSQFLDIISWFELVKQNWFAKITKRSEEKSPLHGRYFWICKSFYEKCEEF